MFRKIIKLHLVIYLSLVCLVTFCQTVYSQADKQISGTGLTVATGSVTGKIDHQIEELNQLFNNYETLAYDTENVIKGLNSLGMHYHKLSQSLIETKDVIGDILNEQKRLREENERLRKINNISKEDLNDFIDYQNNKIKWSSRIEGLIINLIAAFLFGVASYHCILKFKNRKKHNKANSADAKSRAAD